MFVYLWTPCSPVPSAARLRPRLGAYGYHRDRNGGRGTGRRRRLLLLPPCLHLSHARAPGGGLAAIRSVRGYGGGGATSP
jgi:hypothetical protein